MSGKGFKNWLKELWEEELYHIWFDGEKQQIYDTLHLLCWSVLWIGGFIGIVKFMRDWSNCDCTLIELLSN